MALKRSKDAQIPLSFSMRGRALIGQEMFKVLDKARVLEEKGAYIYHLELGNPRLPAPTEIIESTIQSIRDLNVGYTSSSGIPELKRALAKRYTKLAGRRVGEDNIVVSPANLLISQFLDLTCDQGDRVVLFTPAFPTYLVATSHIGLEVIDIPLDAENGFDLTEKDVHQSIEKHPKAILVNSANNPTGAVYSQEILELLARRCHEEGIWLLSDETYAELCFGPSFYSLTALDYPEVVVISSFSKIFSIPGFRTGFAIADESVAAKLALSSSTLISCLPAFTQRGCVAGLSVLDVYVPEVRKRFAQVSKECAEIINSSGVLRCSAPQSAFYIFVNIGASGLDDITFCDKLLEERNTAVTPGRSFGEAYTSFIRLAICGKYEDVKQGLREVVSLVRDTRSHKAMEREIRIGLDSTLGG